MPTACSVQEGVDGAGTAAPACEAELGERSTATLAIASPTARATEPADLDPPFAAVQSEPDDELTISFASSLESLAIPEPEQLQPPSEEDERTADAIESEAPAEGFMVSALEASREGPVEDFVEFAVESSVAAPDELSLHTVDASIAETPIESMGGVEVEAITEPAERSSITSEEERIVLVDEVGNLEPDAPTANVGTAPTTIETRGLLDAELASFRLTPHEVLQVPTPIPGLDNILDEASVTGVEGALEQVAAAIVVAESGEGSPGFEGESCNDATDVRAEAGVAVEQKEEAARMEGASGAARHSDEAPERLAERDEQLQDFVHRTQAQARVLETLEAVARRVRAGEIVPAAPADASPEAVLASVLASLLTARP